MLPAQQVGCSPPPAVLREQKVHSGHVPCLFLPAWPELSQAGQNLSLWRVWGPQVGIPSSSSSVPCPLQVCTSHPRKGSGLPRGRQKSCSVKSTDVTRASAVSVPGAIYREAPWQDLGDCEHMVGFNRRRELSAWRAGWTV